MTTEFKPFVKKVSKSKDGYLFWIPKEVMERLSLDKGSMTHVRIKKIKKELA